MTDETKKVETGNVDDVTQDYVAAIKELKENSVDRSKYDALKAEHKKLLDTVVNGQELEGVQGNEPTLRDPKVIRDELFNHDHSNLEYVTLMLELRNTLIAKGERDPFLPYGEQIQPTAEDIQSAEKCAQVYQECIDYAEGDSTLFTQELQRRTNKSIFDTPMKNNK